MKVLFRYATCRLENHLTQREKKRRCAENNFSMKSCIRQGLPVRHTSVCKMIENNREVFIHA